jgi:hypothetical protein
VRYSVPVLLITFYELITQCILEVVNKCKEVDVSYVNHSQSETSTKRVRKNYTRLSLCQYSNRRPGQYETLQPSHLWLHLKETSSVFRTSMLKKVAIWWLPLESRPFESRHEEAILSKAVHYFPVYLYGSVAILYWNKPRQLQQFTLHLHIIILACFSTVNNLSTCTASLISQSVQWLEYGLDDRGVRVRFPVRERDFSP